MLVPFLLPLSQLYRRSQLDLVEHRAQPGIGHRAPVSLEQPAQAPDGCRGQGAIEQADPDQIQLVQQGTSARQRPGPLARTVVCRLCNQHGTQCGERARRGYARGASRLRGLDVGGEAGRAATRGSRWTTVSRARARSGFRDLHPIWPAALCGARRSCSRRRRRPALSNVQ
jgi:hypothetical protein